ncbi:hypothetical protein VTJ04DRAFT_9664 [Mycothermus thermophilus]|uniref:uncharacterized protein n=1 Tax=Humicola insolens TaxID=85995 RepID=UPI003742B1D2
MSTHAHVLASGPLSSQNEEGQWVWAEMNTAAPIDALPTAPFYSQMMYTTPSSDGSSPSTYNSPAIPFPPTPMTAMSHEFSDFSTGSNNTPVESPVMNFLDAEVDAFMASFLSDDAMAQSWSLPAENPAVTTASLELSSSLDAELFPAPDFPLALDNSADLLPPGPAPYPQPVFPTPVPSAAATFYSPLPQQQQPQQEQANPSSTPVLLPCPEPTCHKTFSNRTELRKHERTHRPAAACPICPKRQLDNRALARHMWAQHPDEAKRLGVPSETARCPFPGCRYEGRRDNVKRHMKRHAPSSGASPVQGR